MTAPATFRPTLLSEVELSNPPPLIPGACTPDGDRYDRVRLLIRSDGYPLGTVEGDLSPDGVAWDTVRLWMEAASLEWAPPPTADDGRETPAVSVVVATRDRPEALRRCLQSLASSRTAPERIVVVENTPRPAEGKGVVSRMAGHGAAVEYVWEPRPGLARAHNSGLRSTTTPVVAFTDDDVVVDTAWTEAIARAFAAHPDAGCVTGLIQPLRLDHPVQAEMERIGFDKGTTARVLRWTEDAGDPLWPFAVGACGSGANMAFRREALADIGGFDVRLGAGTRCRGGDDLAAFFDVLGAGWSIVYRPDALVLHEHASDPDDLTRRAFGYGVGLGSHLARATIREPARLLAVARRSVIGRRRPPHTRSRSAGLPRARWVAGLAYGPVAYVASTLHAPSRTETSPTGRPAWR